MDKEEIILVGGGGHCRSVIDVIEAEERFVIAGIVDVKEKVGQKILGYSVIASDEEIKQLSKQYNNFLVTVGQIKSSDLRTNIYQQLKSFFVNLPVIISPFSRVSKYSQIREGTIIMHHCLVNAGASIGANCIINSGSIVEHDVHISDNCHISTSATVNGGCNIGNNTFVGSNSTIAHGVKIGSFTLIGAGSVILKDAGSKGLYAGNPGTLRKKI
jgi:sugar O-acyltransferase (sialic acid O-acetyltransferase NeuD family)